MKVLFSSLICLAVYLAPLLPWPARLEDAIRSATGESNA